jgi:uncharacterized protein (DUF58 family)
LALALLLGIGAVAAGSAPLLLWCVAIAVIAGGIGAWTRAVWKRVSVTARFTPARAFSGETVQLIVRITNGKQLPLPHVRATIWLPPGLRSGEEPADSLHTIRGFQRDVAMPGRSQIDLELPVRVRNRGEYWLEQIRVQISDPFGLSPVERKLTPEALLLVMPEPRISVPMRVVRRLPFGTPTRASRMFEDRERFAGVRAYEAGDPLNRIHWKLTGHAGVLHTKLFEPTRAADVLLLLDLATGEPFWDSIYPEIAEDTIGWASYLARQAIGSGWRVGLAVNTHMTRGRGPIRVPAEARKGQEAALFAALARMPNEATSDLAPIVREAGRAMGKNATAVVISPRPGPWLNHEMATLRRRGVDVIHLSPLEAAR